jgi:hypothetical protein
MGYLGYKPADKPLTSADITDSIITSAKIADGTITNTDVASSIITGQTAETSIAGGDSILIYDDSATALRKMTRTNFVSGIGGANTPAFSVYQSSNQSISNNSHTKIQFQTEDLDSNNNFDSTTDYRFTPTTAGYYLLTACLRCDSGSSEHFLQLYKNGSNHKSLFDIQTSLYAMNGSALVYANGSTDYFEIYFYQNSGSTRTTTAGASITYFSGFKLIGV